MYYDFLVLYIISWARWSDTTVSSFPISPLLLLPPLIKARLSWSVHVVSPRRRIMIDLSQGWGNTLVKGQIVNIFRLYRPYGPYHNYSTLPPYRESSHRQCVNKQSWRVPLQLYLQQQGPPGLVPGPESGRPMVSANHDKVIPCFPKFPCKQG